MTYIDKTTPGHFTWIELATTDLASAKAFYAETFGWTTTDVPAGPAGTYTMGSLDGRDLCGMYALADEQLQMGVPPHWMIYVAVEDTAKTVAKAKELGATVLVDTMRVMDKGIMAVFQSPTGEAFSVWQTLEEKANGIKDVPGAVSWIELMTKDVEKSKAFYGELFGWDRVPMPMKDMQGRDFEYTLIQVGNEQQGGMMQMGEEFGPIPSHWMVYFLSDNTDDTTNRVVSGGGSVVVPPTDIPVGRFAVVQDPQGATFSVIKLTENNC